ncbi:MAG: hypothetical protein CW691_04830, partial [Candidatus Bathyarchaeum sp.]
MNIKLKLSKRRPKPKGAKKTEILQRLKPRKVLSQKTAKTPNAPKLTFKLTKKQKIDASEVKPTAEFRKLPEAAVAVETYPVTAGYSKVSIASLPELGGGKAYFIEEVALSDVETAQLFMLNAIISKELDPPQNMIDPKRHVADEAVRLSVKYGLDKLIADESWPKLFYYLHRNLIGFGDIDTIMNDPQIEDISVNGVGLPVYVWHRK